MSGICASASMRNVTRQKQKISIGPIYQFAAEDP